MSFCLLACSAAFSRRLPGCVSAPRSCWQSPAPAAASAQTAPSRDFEVESFSYRQCPRGN